MIDFNKLSRPQSRAKPVDPAEIFKRTPNLKDAPNDLWKGQADALESWHKSRTQEDTAIILNTGAGKSIVGILVAQSLVNEDIGPVVYACSTIDLIEQTAKECRRLGIEHTTRARGSFNNDLYETRRAFCITTYQALFNPMSAFKKTRPGAIIFDDAHVAERLIRDSFTLTVVKSKHAQLYDRIIEIVRPEFEKLNKEPHLSFVINDVGQKSVTLCPPATAHNNRAQLIEALKAADYRHKEDLLFPVVQLYEHIQHCAILISSDVIEITPPFIPTGQFEFFGPGVRRVYLSATLEHETDFVRGFGRRLVNRIAPDNDAGNGERLILLSGALDKEADKISVAKAVLRNHKLLISVPSYTKATPWEKIAAPPNVDNFTAALNAFRSAEKGAFVLVSRIDGIDLPQDTCRVMLIDGAPAGISLLDQYLFNHVSLSNVYSTKMAGRITQLLGRINRGRSDFGAFILYGDDLNKWMRTERNVALLPTLIRKQVILGQSLQEGMPNAQAKDIGGVIGQVISRDAGWLKFYRDTIDGLEVSQDALERVRERESQLAESAVAECTFMTRLWQGDIVGARKLLLDVLDSTALADGKLAGWYSVWLGMIYETSGDYETAIGQYKKARSRLSYYLNVPFQSDADAALEKQGATTCLQQSLLRADGNPQALGTLIAKMRIQIRDLTDEKLSYKVHEEAVRTFGELMGYEATRPDNEHGAGPDVVWKDPGGVLIAFELKTKKETRLYNKEEVGQSHNHLRWLEENMSDSQFQGLLMVGPAGQCTAESSPPDNLFLVEVDALSKRMGELVSRIDDTRGRTSLERWTLLRDIGGLSEWQINGWFGSLATTPLGTLRRK